VLCDGDRTQILRRHGQTLGDLYREESGVIKLNKLHAGKKLRKNKNREKVLAAKASNPDATVRELSAQTDVPISTVQYHLASLPEYPEYQKAASMGIRCLEKAAAIIELVLNRGIKKMAAGEPDPEAVSTAITHLKGYRVYSDRHEHEMSGKVGIDGIDSLRNACARLSTAELGRAVSVLASGAIGGTHTDN